LLLSKNVRNPAPLKIEKYGLCLIWAKLRELDCFRRDSWCTQYAWYRYTVFIPASTSLWTLVSGILAPAWLSRGLENKLCMTNASINQRASHFPQTKLSKLLVYPQLRWGGAVFRPHIRISFPELRNTYQLCCVFQYC
jgi:hypothetical protein